MRNSKLRNMIITALLLGIGLVFHLVIPGIFLGMKPDLILAFMFIAYLINSKYANAFLIGVLGGILSGLTSQVGFLPNFIEKIITMHIVYLFYFLLCMIFKIIKLKFDQNYLIAPLIGFMGTLISGSIFITVAILLRIFTFNEFIGLFVVAVLPAVVGNIVITSILYYALKLSIVRSNFNIKLN